MRVALIAARSENEVIGHEGKIPWRLSADLKRFKALTTGHTLIMGRKTFESIGRPLPERVTIVVSRSRGYTPAGVTVVHSLDDALAVAERGVSTSTPPDQTGIFVCGGAEVYRSALPIADHMHLTRVHAIVQGDVHFPEFSDDEWQCAATERHDADEKNAFDYTFEEWERIEVRGQVSGVRASHPDASD